MITQSHIFLIGWNDDWLTSLDQTLPAGSVTVFEEPDVYHGKGLDAKKSRHPALRQVRFAAYQQADEVRHEARRLAAEHPPCAVLPGLEYAVEAAARVAEDLGLPGAGARAARTLRDKLMLRSATKIAGIPNPSFREVTSVADLREFAAGRSCVLKPASRQASLGVQLLGRDDDLAQAWRECVAADEGVQLARRPMRWRYLAEERLAGAVYSVEALVRDGLLLFANITAQETAQGRYPVKTGHVLPAPATPAIGRLPELTQRVAEAVGFGTGVLHAEWIVGSSGTYFVECAGRPPGDFLVDLIHLAHGVDLYRETMRLLAGQPAQIAPASGRFAAIRFVTAAHAGVLTRIDGVERARQTPNIHQVITRQPGEHVRTAKTLWDRVAATIATGPTAPEALAAATAAAQHLVPVVGR